MAGIPRITQIIFGSTGNVGTGGFGAAAGGNTATQLSTSTALSTIMGTTEWTQGWLSAVLGSSKFPAIEDINALDYAMSTQIAYILERGIPEYDAGTSYNIGDITKGIGNSLIYKSITNANIGNSLGNPTFWLACGDLANLGSASFFYTGGVTGGSAGAQTITVNPSGFSLSNDGSTIACTAGFACTGAFTLAASGTTAKSVKIEVAGAYVDPPANYFALDDTLFFTYNVTHGFYILTDSPALGQAASKAVSDNTKTTVASVSGSFTANHFAQIADTAGTIKDGGSIANSLGASGYQTLPGGVIIQWGFTSAGQALSPQTITFPLTFPNAAWAVTSSANLTGGDTGYIDVTSLTTSQFVTAYTISRYWIAIGN